MIDPTPDTRTGNVLGVFSSPCLAMEAPRAKEVREVLKSKPGADTWEERTPGNYVIRSAIAIFISRWRAFRLTDESLGSAP
jgi:hypothetical protein